MGGRKSDFFDRSIEYLKDAAIYMRNTYNAHVITICFTNYPYEDLYPTIYGANPGTHFGINTCSTWYN